MRGPRGSDLDLSTAACQRLSRRGTLVRGGAAVRIVSTDYPDSGELPMRVLPAPAAD
jgi:hypothetical protein